MKLIATEITKGFTLSAEKSQEELEALLLKHGYDRSVMQAAGEYDRATKGGSVLSLPKGKMVFLETLTSVSGWLMNLVQDQLGKPRKAKFYTSLIEPYMAIYLKDQQKAASNKYYEVKYENPVDLLAFFITKELTKLMVQEDRMVTEFSRRIVNNFTMSYNNFNEATNEELVSMIQVIRTYALADENKFFEEFSTSAGIHLTLKDTFKSLHISKEELLESVPNDRSPYKPMLVAPVSHTNLINTEGGYLNLKSPLLKNPEFDIVRQMPFNAENEGAQWFKDINALQETPWAVNVPFFNWLKTCDFEAVKKHFTTDAAQMQIVCNKEVRKIEYQIRQKNKAIQKARFDGSQTTVQDKKVELERFVSNELDAIELLEVEIEEMKSAVGKARGWEETIADAEFYSQFGSFYHPVFCDNRGRVYTYNTSLSPQGSGLSKSLVMTQRKERMSQKGVEGVMELLGGMFDGYSKKKAAVRIQMLEGRLQELWNVVEHKDYSILNEIDEDELLCALTLIHALYNHTHDASYETGILAYIDSTSSAIQIQALAQKCEKAAWLTNLLPNDTDDLPDAYKAVAENCESLVEEIAAQDNDTLYATMLVFLMENAPEKLEFAGVKIPA